MIVSFKDAATDSVRRRIATKKLPADIQKVAYKKIIQINSAGSLDDLKNPPGNRLEALKGDRVGQHSIRINEKWRICFRWRQGNAHDVEIVDYH